MEHCSYGATSDGERCGRYDPDAKTWDQGLGGIGVTSGPRSVIDGGGDPDRAFAYEHSTLVQSVGADKADLIEAVRGLLQTIHAMGIEEDEALTDTGGKAIRELIGGVETGALRRFVGDVQDKVSGAITDRAEAFIIFGSDALVQRADKMWQ